MTAEIGSWRDQVPRSVTDPYDSQGQPVFTPTDRRWLWHLEGELAILAPSGSDLDRVRLDLVAYLRETCEHHYIRFAADDDEPPSRQCIWCQHMEWETPGGWKSEPGECAA